LFLPVKVHVVRVSDDGFGTYREMSLLATPEQKIVENIYHNNVDLVRFVVVGDEAEHVNVIVDEGAGVRSLQFLKRNTATLERVHWPAPLALAVGGINRVLARARALQEGAAPAELAIADPR
jgi:hypothetical protein